MPTGAAKDHNRIVYFQGIPIVIEYDKGDIRTGVNKEGEKWEREMLCPYGYIKDSVAAGDGEGLDVYIGPDPDAEFVYLIEQGTGEDSDGYNVDDFDEYKLCLGFDSLEEAEEMYLAHYPEGWGKTHVNDISEIPFKYMFDAVVKHTGLEPEVAEPKKKSRLEKLEERTGRKFSTTYDRTQLNESNALMETLGWKPIQVNEWAHPFRPKATIQTFNNGWIFRDNGSVKTMGDGPSDLLKFLDEQKLSDPTPQVEDGDSKFLKELRIEGSQTSWANFARSRFAFLKLGIWGQVDTEFLRRAMEQLEPGKPLADLWVLEGGRRQKVIDLANELKKQVNPEVPHHG
jgi:Inorganic Pyrophosphatase